MSILFIPNVKRKNKLPFLYLLNALETERERERLLILT